MGGGEGQLAAGHRPRAHGPRGQPVLFPGHAAGGVRAARPVAAPALAPPARGERDPRFAHLPVLGAYVHDRDHRVVLLHVVPPDPGLCAAPRFLALRRRGHRVRHPRRARQDHDLPGFLPARRGAVFLALARRERENPGADPGLIPATACSGRCPAPRGGDRQRRMAAVRRRGQARQSLRRDPDVLQSHPFHLGHAGAASVRGFLEGNVGESLRAHARRACDGRAAGRFYPGGSHPAPRRTLVRGIFRRRLPAVFQPVFFPRLLLLRDRPFSLRRRGPSARRAVGQHPAAAGSPRLAARRLLRQPAGSLLPEIWHLRALRAGPAAGNRRCDPPGGAPRRRAARLWLGLEFARALLRRTPRRDGASRPRFRVRRPRKHPGQAATAPDFRAAAAPRQALGLHRRVPPRATATLRHGDHAGRHEQRR